MYKIEGTKTEQNLAKAYAGESNAKERYLAFAIKAREEGHKGVAAYFEGTAKNEGVHGDLWLRYLGGKAEKKLAPLLASSTEDNLCNAVTGETYESKDMYPSFAKVAREEGFEAIASLFEQVGEIEESHARHFKELIGRLSPGYCDPPVSAVEDTWECVFCGKIVNTKVAPKSCAVCGNSIYKALMR